MTRKTTASHRRKAKAAIARDRWETYWECAACAAEYPGRRAKCSKCNSGTITYQRRERVT